MKSLILIITTAAIVSGCNVRAGWDFQLDWDAKRFTDNGVPDHCLAYNNPENRDGICRDDLDEICKVASDDVFEYITGKSNDVNAEFKKAEKAADVVQQAVEKHG